MSLEFIKPQLASVVDHPPPRAGWIHEVKHDGYRTVLIIERRKARAYTRNGFDWTERYPGPTKAAAKLDCRSAIIDGEVIVQDEHGVSDFEALKSAIRWRPQSLILCAFDLLHLNGKDLRQLTLLERRGKLKELVPSEHPFLFSEEFTGDAAAFFQACADHQTATDSHGLGTDYRCWNQRKIDRAILPTGTLRVQHGHPPRLARTGQEPFNRVSPARAVQTSIFFNGLL